MHFRAWGSVVVWVLACHFAFFLCCKVYIAVAHVHIHEWPSIIILDLRHLLHESWVEALLLL